MVARMVCLLVLLAGLLVSFEGEAHVRSSSYSWWRFEGNVVTVRWSLSARDLTVVRALDAGARLRLDRACRPGAVTQLPDDQAQRTFRWEIRCERAPRRIIADALFDAIPGHVHFAQVQRDGVQAEHVLTAEHRVIELQQPGEGREAHAASWPALVRLGASHVLGGLDHLVFLLALALLVRSRRQLLWLVSGFTLGHAVSMSLVMLGLVSAHRGTVEALIGASIWLLGVEIVWRQQRRRQPPQRGAHTPVLVGLAVVLMAAAAGAWRGSVRPMALVGVALMSSCYLGWRWHHEEPGGHRSHPSEALLTVVFGAVHGLAFASAFGVLSEQRIAAALLAFNAGVELAQLAVVLVALLLLRAAHRFGYKPLALQLGAAAASCAGVYWLLARVLID